MFINTKNKFQILLLAGTVFFTACKKDKKIEEDPKPTGPTYEIPTTYNFDEVDYSGQTYRLDMLAEMTVLMKTGNTENTTVDKQTLLDMYDNVNNRFSTSELNNSGKKLKDKTFSADVAMFEDFIDSIAQISQSTSVGSDGVAGVVTSGTSKYLCSKYGVEYTQLIEKGLMGAVFYYQIAEVYLGESKIGPQVVKADRQHHWDEAFGYLGVPIDFPSNITGIRFWGKYTNERNALLSCNAKIMNAFLKGRAAINNDDNTTVNEQIVIIREELEKVIAATAISYMNKAKVGISDDAVRNHSLSEGVAFIKALSYSSSKKITNTQINNALNYLKTDGRYNFYNVSDLDLEEIKTILSSVYGLGSIKNSL